MEKETTHAGTTKISRALEILYRFLVVVQTILLGVLLIIVSMQIFIRMFPALPHMLWTEEISRFLLIWVIFLGASIGIRESSHFTVSLLPEPKKRLMVLVLEFIVLAGITTFALIFLIRGGKYAAVMYWDISDIAQVSMAWVGMAIPVFGGLSMIFIAEKVIEIISNGEAQ